MQEPQKSQPYVTGAAVSPFYRRQLEPGGRLLRAGNARAPTLADLRQAPEPGTTACCSLTSCCYSGDAEGREGRTEPHLK